MKIDLLIIDPQNSFVDTPGRPGSLPVTGAYQDCKRLAAFIRRTGARLNDIHVTMDTHRLMDVAHPAWWRAVDPTKPNGYNMAVMPTPGTQIKASEVGTKWTPVIPNMLQRMKDYVVALEANGKYTHTIWPPHCLIGGEGHNIQEDVAKELLNWEEQNIATVDYVTKGSNPFTEHFSAIQAEVPDPNDPGTMLNTNLINTLQQVDMIYIAGEALSHCVKSTVEDIANNFGEENIKKMVLLRDCSSPVIIPGIIDFTPQAEAFIAAMQKRGMKVAKSTEVMQ